ncbi:MAG: hypothetical protein KDK89_14920 [Alphaproteobacteria bacterium]|nr:hypothetical protein [Alphaproteobacteria bacterium]
MTLALFWGLSPAMYRYWGEAGVAISHVIVFTGLGLAVFLAMMARLRHGAVNWDRGIHVYSLACAALMNIPFSFSLTFARHVPPAELALVFSLSPLVNFAIGALSGREPLTARRMMAIAIGFSASALLVFTREGMISGKVSWWLLASFVNPFLFAAYNWYAQRYWPPNGTTFSVGAAESLWSGLLALPFMLVLAPPWTTQYNGQFAA